MNKVFSKSKEHYKYNIGYIIVKLHSERLRKELDSR